MTNADGSDARSVEQCWDLCSAQYGSSLVAVDRWPNNVHLGLPLCFCQNGCTSITREHVDDAGPVELALRPGSIGSSSSLTSCALASTSASQEVASAPGLSTAQMLSIAAGIVILLLICAFFLWRARNEPKPEAASGGAQDLDNGMTSTSSRTNDIEMVEVPERPFAQGFLPSQDVAGMPVAQAFYPRQGASDPASMRAGDAMPVEILEAPGMPTAASVEAPTFALGAKVMVNRGSGDESAGTVVALPVEDDFDVYEVQLDDSMAIEEYSPDQLRAAAEEPSDGNTSSPRYNERLSRARAGNSSRIAHV